MNTVKTIKVREPETAISIEKGTVLKSQNDMFMVVEIYKEEDFNPCNEIINTALYGNTHKFVSSSYSPPTYILVSLSTGGSRFGNPTTIKDLKDQIMDSRVKFHVVRSIEINESN